MNRRKSRMVLRLTVLFLAGVLLAGGGALWWYFMMCAPFRAEVDCRGLGIDVETMKQWEESGRLKESGIVTIAGWRVQKQQTVASVSTGRKASPAVTAVYGSMELVIPTPILCGRYGLDVEGDFCVLSEALARRLFGSAEVSGECVKTEDGIYIVAGVIRREEELLMIPMEEGTVEGLAVKVKGWMGAEDGLQRMMGEGAVPFITNHLAD